MVGRFARSKIRSIWEIWLEKENAEHFDRIGLSGEKERQIFAQIYQSDMIWEKERNRYVTCRHGSRCLSMWGWGQNTLIFRSSQTTWWRFATSGDALVSKLIMSTCLLLLLLLSEDHTNTLHFGPHNLLSLPVAEQPSTCTERQEY